MVITDYDKFDKHAAEGTSEHTLRTRSEYSHGTRGDLPNFYRYVVLETLFDPSLIDDAKASYIEHTLGVNNVQYIRQAPRNSIVAQRIQDGRATAEPPMVLFPFFPPQLAFPCQPGEHVWVMFEASNRRSDLGYWFCRISEPVTVDDVNHTHAPRANDPGMNPGTKDMFDGATPPTPEFRNGRVDVDTSNSNQRFTVGETSTISGGDEKAYEKLITSTDGGKLSHIEAVPRYRKRPGDVALEGTNNALIVLGRDRTGPVAKTKQDQVQGTIVDALPDNDVPLNVDGVGCIDIVAGRGQTDATLGKVTQNSLNLNELNKHPKSVTPAEGDPDIMHDRSRVMVSQLTHSDKNLGIDQYNGKLKSGGVTGSDKGEGAVIAKSDKVRIVARTDVQLLVTGNASDEKSGKPQDDADTTKWATVIVKQDGSVCVQPAHNSLFDVETDSASLKVNPNDIQLFASSVKAGDDQAQALAYAQGISDLQQIFSQWVPVPQDGGAALKSLVMTWALKQYATKKLFGT